MRDVIYEQPLIYEFTTSEHNEIPITGSSVSILKSLINCLFVLLFAFLLNLEIILGQVAMLASKLIFPAKLATEREKYDLVSIVEDFRQEKWL